MKRTLYTKLVETVWCLWKNTAGRCSHMTCSIPTHQRYVRTSVSINFQLEYNLETLTKWKSEHKMFEEILHWDEQATKMTASIWLLICLGSACLLSSPAPLVILCHIAKPIYQLVLDRKAWLHIMDTAMVTCVPTRINECQPSCMHPYGEVQGHFSTSTNMLRNPH